MNKMTFEEWQELNETVLDSSRLRYALGDWERDRIEIQTLADKRLALLEEALRAIEADWTDDNPLGYERYVNTKLTKKIRKELYGD